MSDPTTPQNQSTTSRLGLQSSVSQASVISNDAISPQKRILKASTTTFKLPASNRRKKNSQATANAPLVTPGTFLEKNNFRLIHLGKTNEYNKDDPESPCTVLMLGEGYSNFVMTRPLFGRNTNAMYMGALNVFQEDCNLLDKAFQQKGANGTTPLTEIYFRQGKEHTKNIATICFDIGKEASQSDIIGMYKSVIEPVYLGLSPTFPNGFKPSLSTSKPYVPTDTLSEYMLDEDILRIIQQCYCAGGSVEVYFKTHPGHLYSCWKVGELPIIQIASLNLSQKELHPTDYKRWNDFVQAEKTKNLQEAQDDIERNGVAQREGEDVTGSPEHISNTHENTERVQARLLQEQQQAQATAAREEAVRSQAASEAAARETLRRSNEASDLLQPEIQIPPGVNLTGDLVQETGEILVEDADSESDDDEFLDARGTTPYITQEAHESLVDSDDEDETEMA